MISLLNDILRGLGFATEDLPEGSHLANRSREVLASLPLPLVLCDKRLSILGVTPAFSRLFKLNQEEFQGKTLFQILGSNNFLQVIDQPKPRLLTGDFPKIGPRSFHLLTCRIRSNLLIVFQDVTDEKNLKEKIEKSRSELLSVFDGIDDPMVMIDENFRIKRINESMRKVLGAASYRNLIGKACYYGLHGRNSVCPGCTAGKTFATGEKTQRLGLIERRPQADEFSYQITCHPLKDAAGSVTAIDETYRDLTELMRTEEELYESERNRVMGPLVAGIAHEIRNPLAIIQSTAQYSLGELRQDQKELRESLETIFRNTQQANRVVCNLLDFARPNPADFKRQPLRPLLQKALNLVKARAASQKVRLVSRVSDSIRPLILDGNRFVQAMMNLLVNSLDAMPHGGRLEVETRRQNGNRTTVVRIKDSGEGIAEEVLPQILQPFYTTKKNGVGLGLPIAEGIIRSHGGRLQFRSERGKGCEVTVALPMRKRLLAP